MTKAPNLKLIVTFVLVALSLISCQDEASDTLGEIKTKHELNLINNLEAYQNLSTADSSNNIGYGDTFDIDRFYVEDNWLNVIIGYSGGCKVHTFDIVWDGNTSITIDSTYTDSIHFDSTISAIINIAIKHDANNDACEAYITDTLKIDLNTLLEEFGNTLPNDYIINIINGYNGDEGNCGTGNYLFPESEECILRVTAEKAICGTGVWGDIWFRINRGANPNTDSLDLLLQPVALESEWLTAPEVGKTYDVGVQLSYIADSTVSCLAYPGLSVPVKVYCFEEVE